MLVSAVQIIPTTPIITDCSNYAYGHNIGTALVQGHVKICLPK